MPIFKTNDFWMANNNYYSTDRYKSIVIHNNLLYCCTVTHKSEETFDETKFALLSGSGGGSLSDRYAGVWDLSQVTNDIIESEPDLSLSTGFLKISSSEIKYLGDDTPFTSNSGNTYYDVVIANGVTPINTGIRWACAYMPNFSPSDNALGFSLTIQNNTTSVDAIQKIFFNSTLPTNPVTGAILLTQILPGSQMAILVYKIENNNIVSNFEVLSTVISTPEPGTPIFFGIDTSTGEIKLEIDATVYDFSGNLLDLTLFQTDTFTSSYSIIWENSTILSVANPNTFTFDLGTSLNEKLPFLSLTQTVTLPLNILDGYFYECINGSGSVNGTYVQSGDLVEFFDNSQRLNVTRPSLTTTQVENIAENVIADNLVIGTQLGNYVKGNAIYKNLTVPNYLNIFIENDKDVVIIDSLYITTGVSFTLPDPEGIVQGRRILIYAFNEFTNVSFLSANATIISNTTNISQYQTIEFMVIKRIAETIGYKQNESICSHFLSTYSNYSFHLFYLGDHSFSLLISQTHLFTAFYIFHGTYLLLISSIQGHVQQLFYYYLFFV